MILHDKTIVWLSSFLRDRTFTVRVDGDFSLPRWEPSGVPQGLSPVLFVAVVSDVRNYLPREVSYLLYADDLKVYTSVDSDLDAQPLQAAIDGISHWCRVNYMLVAAHKCALLRYKSVDASYRIDGTEISLEETVRDLGVMISANLNFAAHVVATSSSARNVINTLFRCFVIQNRDVYVRLYKAIIVPRLMYCIPVWRPYLIKYVGLLEGVQKHFLRRLAFRCSSTRTLPVIPARYSLRCSITVMKMLFFLFLRMAPSPII